MSIVKHRMIHLNLEALITTPTTKAAKFRKEDIDKRCEYGISIPQISATMA